MSHQDIEPDTQLQADVEVAWRQSWRMTNLLTNLRKELRGCECDDMPWGSYPYCEHFMRRDNE